MTEIFFVVVPWTDEVSHQGNKKTFRIFPNVNRKAFVGRVTILLKISSHSIQRDHLTFHNILCTLS